MLKHILLFSVLLLCTACLREKDSFKFHGKDIEALCIPENKGQKINLKKCGSNNGEFLFEEKESSPLEQKYKFKSEAEFPSFCYATYKYIGKLGDNHVILVNNNTGGTGWFSSIPIIKKEGDELTVVDNLAFGDRCNGGISEVYIKDGKVYYYQHLTPYDIIYSQLEDKTNEAVLDDLKVCASCCYGQLHMEGSQPIGLKIDDDMESILRENGDSLAEQIFNKTLLKVIQENKSNYLTVEQHKKFVDEYVKAVTESL